MHPDYEKHMRPKRSGDALRFRATEEERSRLDNIIAVEGGSLTELLVEGLWRVIDNRENDPQFQAHKNEALSLQAKLEELRADLHSTEA